jgi:hypothetical protein
MGNSLTNIAKPSIEFCITGCLANGEVYDQELHNIGTTVAGRAGTFYSPEEIKEMENEAKKRLILWEINPTLIFLLESNKKGRMKTFNQTTVGAFEKDILTSKNVTSDTHVVEMYFNNTEIIGIFKTLEELGITSESEIFVCVKKHGQSDEEASNDYFLEYLFEGLPSV